MADIVLMLIAGYLLVGLVFGVYFVFGGVGRVDPVANDSPLVFRLLILPGAVGLWPLMLKKWWQAKAGEAG